MKFAFIEEHLAGTFPVDVACEVLDVSRSGYYAWLNRPASARAERREELAAKTEAVHKENRGVYGSPRVHRALLAEGGQACVNTVPDIMKEREIRARTKRTFVPRTTVSQPGQPAVANVLDRQFDADLPNQTWAVDITSVATDKEWLYRAGVMDLCSPKVVGWSMADPMETSLVSDARVADGDRRPEPGRGAAAPRRPWVAVRQRRRRASAADARDGGEHERRGPVLGQRREGELLGHAQDRVGPPRAVRHAGAGAGVNL